MATKTRTSIIAPQKSEEKETLNVSIEKPVYDMVDRYAQYLDGSQRGYVVQELLRYALHSDKAFQEALKSGKLEPKPAPVAEKAAKA